MSKVKILLGERRTCPGVPSVRPQPKSVQVQPSATIMPILVRLFVSSNVPFCKTFDMFLRGSVRLAPTALFPGKVSVTQYAVDHDKRSPALSSTRKKDVAITT